MTKFKKGMFIIPIAFASVLSVAAVTSCSDVKVDYEKDKPIQGVSFNEDTSVDYNNSVKRVGILRNTSDLIALYKNAKPYSEEIYKKFFPAISAADIKNAEKLLKDTLKKLEEKKDEKLPQTTANKVLIYFISRGSTKNFVDSVLLTENKRLIVNFINKEAISGSKDTETEPTTTTFMILPQGDYSGIQVNEIKTMEEFKKYKKDADISTYTRRIARTSSLNPFTNF